MQIDEIHDEKTVNIVLDNDAKDNIIYSVPIINTFESIQFSIIKPSMCEHSTRYIWIFTEFYYNLENIENPSYLETEKIVKNSNKN